MMRNATRRTVLAGTGVALAAAVTVATRALRSKPAPVVLSPAAAPPAEALQTMSALVPTDPPQALADVSFQAADGTVHHLAEFAGKPVVLNLWATWCAPCVAELPSLAMLARRAASAGVVVLAVSNDHGGAPVVQRFYDSHHIDGLGVWLDPQMGLAEALGARGLPTTFIIDRTGRERGRLEGSADWGSDAALAAIQRLAGTA